MGRYLEAAVNGNGNYSALLPASRVPTSVTRTWTDRERRLRAGLRSAEPSAQISGPRSTSAARSASWRSAAAIRTLFYDPAIMQGWGVRPGDWQVGATLQHEVLPRVSMEVGYTRRWLQNFTVTDNRATSVAGLTRPSASRRRSIRGCRAAAATWSPGSSTPIPNSRRLTDNYRTYAPNYGNQYQIYNGLESNVNARLRNGIQLQAGTQHRAAGHRLLRGPGEAAGRPAILDRQRGAGLQPVNPNCHNAPGITTRATAAGSYTIPKIDVLLSGTFQSSPGVPLAANYVVPSAVVAQALGRPLSGNVHQHHRQPAQARRGHGASGSISSTSASARSCASAGSGRPFRRTCSTR